MPGVRKRVITPGDGEGVVGPGAAVSVRYALSLAGADVPFDSSEARRGGVLKFTLGKRKALSGLEVLAESMEVGEVCEGEVDALRAYGNAGLPRCGVPGGAMICVSMTMVAATPVEKAKSMVEMTSMERFTEAGACKERGNAFFKEAKTEKAVAEYQRCLRYIEYIFYQPRPAPVSNASSVTGEEEENDSKEDRESKCAVEGTSEGVGSHAKDGCIVEAESEERGVENEGQAGDSVNKEENADPEGESGASPEKGSTDEESIVQIDATRPSGETKVPADGETDVDEADSGFVEAEVSESAEEGKLASNDPAEEDVRELHVVCLNNLCLCLLKLAENKKVVELASLSARMDPANHKPLFYRGRARHAMADYDEAKADLFAAAKLAPRNMGIRIEIDKLTKKMKIHKAQERKAAAAMFG